MSSSQNVDNTIVTVTRCLHTTPLVLPPSFERGWRSKKKIDLERVPKGVSRITVLPRRSRYVYRYPLCMARKERSSHPA